MKNNLTSPSINNLSSLFFLSTAFGLMPCAREDATNRKLRAYSVVVHVAYRIINVTVLALFLLTTTTSASLISLLTIVTVLKFLCTTVHVILIIRNRKRLLKLVRRCEESDFLHNSYRTVTKLAILYALYLYVTGQAIQRRWESALRDIFSSIDVICPILIVLQFCTFLKIATEKFKQARLNLVVYFYKTDEILEQHMKNLELATELQQLYTNQMFLCVCYLGFDFFVASYDSMEKIMQGKDLVWLLCTTSYCGLCIITIFFLCRACEITKAKAEKFDNELYLLMNENNALRKSTKLQLYMRNRVVINFTGSHFFNIGYPLVTSIIAATTTYLIILMQYSPKSA